MTQEEFDEFATGLEMVMQQFSDVLTFTWDDDEGLMLARAANGQWIEAKAVEDSGQHYVCFTTSWGDQYCEQFIMPAVDPVDMSDMDWSWLVSAAPILTGGWDTNVFN